MTTHYVKSWMHLYDAIASGMKKHDIRDMRERDYKVGDQMVLQRFDHINGQYTGEQLVVLITYITSNNTPCAFSSGCLDKNFAILSVEILDESVDNV